ncbi:transposase, mutator type (plasmid) [Bradyrhizobium diazoefficiens]|uniref:Mutator family transposase n=1 Tax=Bradyrhizobium diazoefficiens TaxID=1355477 RepID=A0A0E4BYV9_9BRAD|nr:transposase, mutator type [Bradyrhizobium diazoefficiens]
MTRLNGFTQLHRKVLLLARESEVCRRLMTIPGVGPVTSLAFISTIDVPARFKSSKAVGPSLENSVFPKTMVQTCIVHLIRNSLSFVSWKDRKAILPSIKAIYHAENADAALLRLEDFEAEWGKRYPAIGAAWRRAWEHVIPFFAFAPEIRKMIYTTNAVEALNRSLRKIIKTRGSFPNDEAAMKLLYLAIRNAGIHWRRPVAWTAAMGQFAIQFGERFAGSAD